MIVDETRLNEFAGRFAGDLGAVLHAATVIVGDRLGLYAAMGAERPMTPAELAKRTGIYYSASTMICVPASRSEDVGLALGAQAGDARMRGVVEQGGFTRFRRATDTPFNAVYEVRP